MTIPPCSPKFDSNSIAEVTSRLSMPTFGSSVHGVLITVNVSNISFSLWQEIKLALLQKNHCRSDALLICLPNHCR
jgi:hypothetical protein